MDHYHGQHHHPDDKYNRERVFLKLLKDKNIIVDTPWEKVMKEIMSHPDYRAIQTIPERKALWERYTAQLKTQTEALKKEQMNNLKFELWDWLDMFDHVERVHYSDLLKVEEFDRFKNVLSEREFKQLLEEYCVTLKERQEDERNVKRKEIKEHLFKMLKQFNLSIYSKWLDYRDLLFNDPSINTALKRGIIAPKDVLYSFEDYILEEMNKGKRKEYDVQAPLQSSIPIEEFKNMIIGFVGIEECWSTLWHHLLKNQSSFINYSLLPALQSPMPLLDVYYQVLDANRRLFEKEYPIIHDCVQRRLKDYIKEFEFIEFVKKRREDVSVFSCKIYYQLYINKDTNRENQEQLRKKESVTDTESIINKKNENGNIINDGEDKRLIEAYKHSLKHSYDPPIQLGSKWPDFEQTIYSTNEYKSLPDKSLGRYYFEKYQKYLSKKKKLLVNNEDDIEEGELQL